MVILRLEVTIIKHMKGNIFSVVMNVTMEVIGMQIWKPTKNQNMKKKYISAKIAVTTQNGTHYSESTNG